MSSGPDAGVVLVGAGHAHLHVARRAERFTRRGVPLTLVDPGDFWYSGAATGMLGGMYDPTVDRIDARALVEAHGGRFVRDRLTAIDTADRRLSLASGRTLGYRAVSLNVGSEVPIERLKGAERHAWSVKPIANLWRLRRELEERWETGKTDGASAPVRVVVVGGGATGCEVTANLDALALRRGTALAVTLIQGGSRLLPVATPSAAGRLARHLRDRDIRVELSCRVARVESDAVITRAGRRFPADIIVVATGLRPPELIGELGLPRGTHGGLAVDATLGARDYDRVFGAGDCIDFAGRDLPKLGVFAVRQAPVLLRNLRSTIEGEPLETYEPQKRYLRILNLGDGRALALWDGLHWLGRTSQWLKDRLDRSFLDRYRCEHAGRGTKRETGDR